MIQNKFNFHFGFLIVVFFFALGCQKEQNVPTEFKSIDSIWTKTKVALATDSLGYRAAISYLYPSRNYSLKEIDWLISQMRKHPDWEESGSPLPSAANLVYAWHFESTDEDSLKFVYLDKINTDQIDIKCSKIQAFALHYYQSDQPDSSLNYFYQIYEYAKSHENRHWVLQSANNLGTLHFDLHDYEMATEYFTEALNIAQEYHLQIPMLINNVITCALVNSKAGEAKDLYNKYKSIFKPHNDYEKTIYELNKIHIFYKSNEIDSFKYYLDRINFKNFGEKLQTIYDQQYLFYFVKTRDWKSYNALFEKYKQGILDDPSWQIIRWSEVLASSFAENNFPFTKSELLEIYKTVSAEKNLEAINDVTILLEEISPSEIEKRNWELIGLKAEIEQKKQSQINFQNELKNQIRINELNNENQNIKLQLEITNAKKKSFITMFIGSVACLMALAFAFILFRKNRKIAIEKLQLELQNNRTLFELGQNKKQFAERLIAAQEAISAKILIIISKLKQTPFNKDPEIIQIRKELSTIADLNTEWEHELDSINTNDDIQFLYDHFDCIRNFNQTEQRLLYYFIHQHKVKEIAALLSISEQHVRNTKTKLIKTLSQEYGKTLKYEDLLAFKNEGPI